MRQPAWFWDYLGAPVDVSDGARFGAFGSQFVMRASIPRQQEAATQTQSETRNAFTFIWSGTDRFQDERSLAPISAWFRESFGDIAQAAWWSEYGESPLVVEAGCGVGISGTEVFGPRANNVRYLALDISDAIDAAAARFVSRALTAGFMQADMMRLQLPECSVDVVFSQGALHHTDSTEAAIKRLAQWLKIGGRFLFYVYRKKGPIREFTDDYLREKLQGLDRQEQRRQMMALTRLGEALGRLKVEVDVPEAVNLLEIPAGKIDLQRLFYWHVAKAYYRPEFTLDEMNHVNLDWYLPVNAHRASPEDVRMWCREAGLEIEREHLQEAGIAVTAIRRK